MDNLYDFKIEGVFKSEQLDSMLLEINNCEFCNDGAFCLHLKEGVFDAVNKVCTGVIEVICNEIISEIIEEKLNEMIFCEFCHNQADNILFTKLETIASDEDSIHGEKKNGVYLWERELGKEKIIEQTWVAEYVNKGKKLRRLFNASKYGYQEAYELACKARNDFEGETIYCDYLINGERIVINYYNGVLTSKFILCLSDILVHFLYSVEFNGNTIFLQNEEEQDCVLYDDMRSFIEDWLSSLEIDMTDNENLDYTDWISLLKTYLIS